MAGIEKWKKQKLIIDKAPNICYNVWCVKRNMSWSQQEARVRMRYKIIRTKLISRCGAEPRALGERAKISRCDVFAKWRSQSKECCYANYSRSKTTMRRDRADKARLDSKKRITKQSTRCGAAGDVSERRQCRNKRGIRSGSDLPIGKRLAAQTEA